MFLLLNIILIDANGINPYAADAKMPMQGAERIVAIPRDWDLHTGTR
jgi:hypothetical protein